MKIRRYINRSIRSFRGVEARQAPKAPRLIPGGFDVLREIAEADPRAGLRAPMAASPLLDHAGLAAAVEPAEDRP